MKILQDYDLFYLNTLAVHTRAKFFTEIKHVEDLKELFRCKEFQENNKIFLGGGSNILFTHNFDGLVILNKIQGIEIMNENPDKVTVRAMSGVPWDELVQFTVERGYWGIENLSLIPGTVGGAPVQNIGAYGSEIKDVIDTVEAYNLSDGSKKIFTKLECNFGYRDSVFKNIYKGQYFISAITIVLSKTPKPNISYKILADYLQEHGFVKPSLKEVSDAVSHIRRSKLPDPKFISNAGSFFKNVFVDKDTLENLQKVYSNLIYFNEGSKIKIPAAWLIETCGPIEGVSWKGYRRGNVGVHEKHALILVNYGGATGQEIYELAKNIIESIRLKFNIELIPEVNLI